MISSGRVARSDGDAAASGNRCKSALPNFVSAASVLQSVTDGIVDTHLVLGKRLMDYTLNEQKESKAARQAFVIRTR